MSQPTHLLPPRRNPPPPVMWRSWPLMEDGFQAWCMALFGLAAFAMVAAITADARWAIVACMLLALSAWRFFVPTFFEMNGHGIHEEILGSRRVVPWKVVDSVEICRSGIYLSLASGFWSPFRGLYVPWVGRREEILALVQFHLLQPRHDDRAYDFSYRESGAAK